MNKVAQVRSWTFIKLNRIGEPTAKTNQKKSSESISGTQSEKRKLKYPGTGRQSPPCNI